MPLPSPKGEESLKDFISRCTPLVIKAEDLDPDDEESRSQAVAICNSRWEKAKTGKSVLDDLSGSEELFVGMGSLSIKDFGDGRVGGYLVNFTDPDRPDLERDYFDASTYYGPHKTTLVLYHHGLDPTLGPTPMKNIGTLDYRDTGVWLEHQLDLREEYEAAVYQLIQSGKAGLSSGTASHLMERKQIGNVYHITRWPLGLDASYTPAPANAGSVVMPLKSYMKMFGGSAALDLSGVKVEDYPDVETSSPKGAEAPGEGGTKDGSDILRLKLKLLSTFSLED